MHRLILTLISLVMAGNSFAATISTLYQAQLPVATQTEAERDRIAPDVLKDVLLKVVGDSAALNSANLTPILKQSKHYISQYQYRRINTISDDLTQPDKLELQLTFNEQQINQSLVDLGLPVWGRSRPDVLLWLTIDDGSSRTIVGEDSADTMIPLMIKQAIEKRGLSLLIPLMDLQGQAELSFAEVWAGFPKPILKASQRYDAQVIVMARVAINDDAMQIRWQSITNNEAEHWSSKGNAETALKSGVSELVDRTARRFTQVINNQSAQQYDVQINNIKSYADYIRVKHYLTSLHYISDVKLSSLVDDKLEISILLSSDLSVFNQTIAIGRVLEEQTNYHSSDVIHYKLLL